MDKRCFGSKERFNLSTKKQKTNCTVFLVNVLLLESFYCTVQRNAALRILSVIQIYTVCALEEIVIIIIHIIIHPSCLHIVSTKLRTTTVSTMHSTILYTFSASALLLYGFLNYCLMAFGNSFCCNATRVALFQFFLKFFGTCKSSHERPDHLLVDGPVLYELCE